MIFLLIIFILACLVGFRDVISSALVQIIVPFLIKPIFFLFILSLLLQRQERRVKKHRAADFLEHIPLSVAEIGFAAASIAGQSLFFLSLWLGCIVIFIRTVFRSCASTLQTTD